MKALDLFCGAGGASRGLQFAGFDVTGVDLVPQPRYAGGVADFKMEQAHAAMGIDWMTLAELSQAIPPAYAEFLGHIAFNRTKEAA